MSSITADLAEVLAGVKRPGDFCTTGINRVFAPSLEVEGVGPIALPFLRIQRDPLIAAAERAPYGRGDQTLVDIDVRRSWQIEPAKVRLRGAGWTESLRGIVDRVAGGLGVTGPVEAELYKLLVYDEGGFFVSHRDTEKAAGMFGTLIIVLPSLYTGGALVVRHQDREVRFEPHGEDPSEIAFAAFYADCLHELEPVTSGCRLALVYNLLRKGKGDLPEPPNHDTERDRLADLLRRWSEEEVPARPRRAVDADVADASDAADEWDDEDDGAVEEDDDEDYDGYLDEDEDEDDEEYAGPPLKLIYPLEHVYTPAGLSFDALKGADAARAATLLAAARLADCDVQLALLSLEESGSAVYTGYGYGRRGRDEEEDEEDFEVEEVFDSEQTLSDWCRPDGRPSVLTTLPAHDKEISPPDALDDMVPDKQSFFEATGNAGASFERSYRKAALVLWPNRRWLAILDQGGLDDSLRYLADLAAQWVDGGRDPRSAIRSLAHELSGLMVASWPAGRWSAAPTSGNVRKMLGLLGELDDVAHIDRFLAEIPFGAVDADAGAAILEALPRLPAERRVERLARIAAGKGASGLDVASLLLAQAATAAAKGDLGLRPADLRPAAEALLATLPGDPEQASALFRSQPPKLEPEVLVHVLTAFAAIAPEVADAAVDLILAWPETYDLDELVVPGVLKLDSRTEAKAFRRLHTAALVHLSSRIGEQLKPPRDWARASDVGCRCEHCRQLSRFLADPGQKTWHFKAVQASRSHVEGTIRRRKCDVDCTTMRSGSPHTLVCTKNQASYDRRAKRRQKDLSDLAKIETWHR